MPQIIQFQTFLEDGHYTASAFGAPIVTQGKTLDELMQNIQEATDLYFEEEFAPQTPLPPVLINYELPRKKAYA